MTDPKFPSHVGLLATLCGRGGLEDQIVAEGLYVADCVSGVAELDLSVADQHQRRGIGSLLLETLVGWARCARLVRIDAEVLASNHDALQFLVSRGFRYDGCPSGGVCRVFLPIEEAKRACSEPAITSDSF